MRYIDPIEIRNIFVQRKRKQNGRDDPYVRINNKSDDVPNPQFDEYYIYTMKPNYPTGMVARAGKGSVKIAKTQLHIVHQDW